MTGEEQARVPIAGRFCQTMAAGFDALWACVDDGMVRIDPASNSVVAHVAFDAPRVAGRPAISPEAVWSLAGDIVADSVVRIDPASNAVTATLPLGHSVESLAFGFDALWATSAADGLLLRIDPATGAVTEHLAGLPTPSGVATGAGSVWLFRYASNDEPQYAPGDPVMLRVDPASAETTLVDVGVNPQGYGDIWATDDAVWVRGIDPVLVRLDPESGAIAWTGVGNEAHGSVGVTFGAVWVTNVEFQTVWRIDLDQTD